MIEGSVNGGTEVVERLGALPASLRSHLRQAVAGLTISLQNRVKGKLDGEVLKRRTGLLRRSIEQAVVEQGDNVTGIVSTAASYARAHEYGFNGVVNVREHLRTIKQAFGRSINPVTFTVSAHAAHMHLPERSFLRSSLREMEQRGEIRDGLREAVKGALS